MQIFSHVDYEQTSRADFEMFRAIALDLLADGYPTVTAETHKGDVIGTAAARYPRAVADVGLLVRADDGASAREGVAMILAELANDDPLLFRDTPTRGELVALRLKSHKIGQPDDTALQYHVYEADRADVAEKRRQFYAIAHELGETKTAEALKQAPRYELRPSRMGVSASHQ